MEIVNAAAERSQVEIGWYERLIVNAVLNKVCNRVAVFEFGNQIGVDRSQKICGNVVDVNHLSLVGH